MFEWFIKNLSKDNRGFTLIELVVVIAILAILALIAVPRFIGTTDKAAVSAHNANVRTLESAANTYLAEEGLPAENIENAKEVLKDYVQEWPKVPEGARTDMDGQDYIVKIDTSGEITVTPPKNNE